jgi:hypothetical protein
VRPLAGSNPAPSFRFKSERGRRLRSVVLRSTRLAGIVATVDGSRDGHKLMVRIERSHRCQIGTDGKLPSVPSSALCAGHSRTVALTGWHRHTPAPEIGFGVSRPRSQAAPSTIPGAPSNEDRDHWRRAEVAVSNSRGAGDVGEPRRGIGDRARAMTPAEAGPGLEVRSGSQGGDQLEAGSQEEASGPARGTGRRIRFVAPTPPDCASAGGM